MNPIALLGIFLLFFICSEPFSENPADEFQVQHPELRQDR